MLNKRPPLEKMSAETRQSIALVLMGNFLEYFDLMLGVHLAVVLNKIFLPQDTGYEHILRPLTFLLPLLMRPFAAIIWGHIGDSTGRKAVLVSTMFIMGGSCLFLTILPTYATWGLTSTILFFSVRSIQAFASAGELAGAEIYIAETAPVPNCYYAACFIGVTAGLGGLLACLIGYFTTLVDPVSGWRYAFIIGAFIAAFGAVARKDIRETPEFIKRQLKSINFDRLKPIEDKFKVHCKTNVIFLISMYCIFGYIFFFIYSHCNSLLVKHFDFTPTQVLMNSALLIAWNVTITFIFGKVALRVNPVKLFRFFFLYLIVAGLALSMSTCWLESSFNLRLMQFIICAVPGGLDITVPFLVKSFPIRTRMRFSMWSWAISKTAIYIITAVLCGWIDDLNSLLVIMSGVAGLSYAGLHFFKTYDKMLNKDEIRTLTSFQKLVSTHTDLCLIEGEYR